MKEIRLNNLRNIRSEPASLQIGKNGLSEKLSDELNSRLKHNSMIKIKFLKNSPFKTREEAFSELQKFLKDDIKILEKRGWTVILQKKK